MDAYNFANSIVFIHFSVYASAVSTVIIPSFMKKTDRKRSGFIYQRQYTWLSGDYCRCYHFKIQNRGRFHQQG
jgi:hypothetical protein